MKSGHRFVTWWSFVRTRGDGNDHTSILGFWIKFDVQISWFYLYFDSLSLPTLKFFLTPPIVSPSQHQSFLDLKHLRTLELSDAVLITDFSFWEVLGTLPSLENLTLEAYDPASHPAHAPENSNSRSGNLRYFDALEKLNISGSVFLIQHFLGFIDSPCLKSI